MITITDECISCQACVEECENDAIFEEGEEYTLNGESQVPLSDDHTFIVPELCTECESCIDVCAVDAIEKQ